MRNHNHVNQRIHPKYNGYPYILLSVCGINKVSVYNSVINKQLLYYREYPDPYKGGVYSWNIKGNDWCQRSE